MQRNPEKRREMQRNACSEMHRNAAVLHHRVRVRTLKSRKKALRKVLKKVLKKKSSFLGAQKSTQKSALN